MDSIKKVLEGFFPKISFDKENNRYVVKGNFLGANLSEYILRVRSAFKGYNKVVRKGC